MMRLKVPEPLKGIVASVVATGVRIAYLKAMSTTYEPPWKQSTKPYYRGYTIMSRRVSDRLQWEVWHYASDRLLHAAPTWAAAKRWADEHPAIPACGEAERSWNHLALY
jgi:hypothetical protein